MSQDKTPLPEILNPIQTLESECIYENKYLQFYKDRVRLDDGLEKEYAYMKPHSGVNILALDEKNRITLVGQWRYAMQCSSWELPAGFMETGEDPLEAAKRELAEEAALTAKTWKKLGHMGLAVSVSTHQNHIFLATELCELPSQKLDDDERIKIIKVSLDEAVEMVKSGEIIDMTTAYAIFRVRDDLRSSE